MNRHNLYTLIVLPFLALVICAVGLVAWQASASLRQFHLLEMAVSLEAQAGLCGRLMAGLFDEAHQGEVDALCKSIEKSSGSRISVILPSGMVIGDSDEDPRRMDNHGDRPEVRAALRGEVGHSVRYSQSLHQKWFYVAVPIEEGGSLAAVIRASASFDSVNAVLWRVYLRIALVTVVVGLVVCLLAWRITRRVSKPLAQMGRGMSELARQNFRASIPTPRVSELAVLAGAVNEMAAKISDDLEVINRQRDELQTVLASMAEGVIAVDRRERLISMNRKAAQLFGVDATVSVGRDIREVVRNPKLQYCVSRTLVSLETETCGVLLSRNDERHLEVTSTVLRDGEGRPAGALLVLNDVTELRRLERVRNDFFASVTHEIRTPVTSIKGYAETLKGGAVDDAEVRGRFLETIVRQADRLCMLVDDILSLAHLERSELTADIPFEQLGMAELVAAAVQFCQPKADEKGIAISVAGEDAVLTGNKPLIEHALANLIDNAIKYSERGRSIRIEISQVERDFVVSVRDEGCGIAAEHLPRIFERFYRIDRARSRQLGGTGLGLAIVKHIMALHHGAACVESTLGKGSCFRLHFPRELGVNS